MPEEIKYIHDEIAHNQTDPAIIVPVIMDLINPKSVVDVGCGIGTFLKAFKEHGVGKVLGLDGKWVNYELLRHHIDLKDFKEVNLEEKIILEERYDLAICLEVAEHLSPESADILVDNLTSYSDYILFSAAIPGQMGQNHINEQWPDYWQKKFDSKGYVFHDILRPMFWDNALLARWYKQNVFLVSKKHIDGKFKGLRSFSDEKMLSLVHPEYFSLRVNELGNIEKSNEDLFEQYKLLSQGKSKFLVYLKLLAKKLLIMLHLRK